MPGRAAQYFDVLIVGAGISGIGGAYHLTKQCPGATAATLIPAIAPVCRHVTMLQRSPTFYRTGRNAIEIADELRALQIDEAWIHEIVRRKILYEQSIFTRRSFSEPEK